MEFIDFLKYGAIGISLALAILSYRLLSKEQEKDTERPGMLKSIKNYFMIAVFLSVFFGMLEFASKLFLNNNVDPNSELELIWIRHFSSYSDSTLTQKADRIATAIYRPTVRIDTTRICESLIVEMKKLKGKLADYDNGFYENIVKLKNQLRKDPDGWTNLSHGTNSKAEIFDALNNIFRRLGLSYENLSNDEIINKWVNYKGAYTNEQQVYVFESDITRLVQLYLDTFSD